MPRTRVTNMLVADAGSHAIMFCKARADQHGASTRTPNQFEARWLFLQQWKVYVLPKFRHKTKQAEEGGATSCSAPPSFFVPYPFWAILLRRENSKQARR